MIKPALATTVLLAATQAVFAFYAIGDTPDDFTCTDWDGNDWNLDDQRGKVVFINFGSRT